jgi:hypothetical protein
VRVAASSAANRGNEERSMAEASGEQVVVG